MNNNETSLEIKFDNLTRSEKVFRYLVRAFIVLGLTFVYVISEKGFMAYLIGAALGFILINLVYDWVTKPLITEIRIHEGIVVQSLQHPIFIKDRRYSLGKFDTVQCELVSGRGGPRWISVLLSGKHRSLEVARFGPTDLIVENSRYSDHPGAKLLRAEIATKTRFRDIGLV